MQKAARCYLSNISPEEALDLTKSLNSLEVLLRLRYSEFRTGDLRVVNPRYLATDGPQVSPTDKCAIEFTYNYTSGIGHRNQREAVIVIEEDGKVRLASDEEV